MNTPANIIHTLLIERGHITNTGKWKGYVAFLPDDPHESVCLYDTPGRPDGRLHRGGTQIIHPGIQIEVRGRTYLEGWQKTQAIALFLDTVNKISVAMESDVSYVLHNISRTGDIFPLGVEGDGDRKRHRFVINAVVTVTESEGIDEDDDMLPAGIILMWSGTIASIPSGWALCNGSNGTPDLRNRFIVGANADDAGVAKSTVAGLAAQSGGTNTHTHGNSFGVTGTLAAGPSIIAAGGGSYLPNFTGTMNGTVTAETTVPPFYALAYIMKL